eukprot:TRINITY_DN823_c0_g1_i1.p1 TRINITY_DN823_c0_g1~~TRINITY_DN823_c0_g1_i1.p1  ORF type:complete len:2211 (-),score=610.88 TRINITY_DN823_c0_g1_i1:1218-7850(-)
MRFCALVLPVLLCVLGTTLGYQGRYNVGYSLSFSRGSQAFVQIPSVRVGGAGSIEFWVNLASATDGGPVLELGNNQVRDRLRVYAYPWGVGFELSGTLSQANRTLALNTWNHVVITIGSTGSLVIYLNEVAIVTLANIAVPAWTARATNYIGRTTDGAYFVGGLDEVRLWGKERAANQLAPRPLDVIADGVIFAFSFDEGQGTITYDSVLKIVGSLGGGQASRRPGWVVPAQPAFATCTSWGDPHYITFDGTKYSFMPPGDYWLVRDVPTRPASIQIQTRTASCGRGVSCNSAVAFRTAGGSKLAIMFNDNVTKKVRVYLNDSPSDQFLTLFPGGVVARFSDRVEVEVFGQFTLLVTSVNVYVRLTTDKYNTVSGLCGFFDGKLASDLRGPSNNTFATADMNTGFGLTWKVTSPDVSFFPYGNPVSSTPETPPGWPADGRLYRLAQDFCNNTAWVLPSLVEQCLYDVRVMGDITGAIMSADASLQICKDSEVKLGFPLCNKGNMTCPNFCSMKGSCYGGQCRCIDGWTGPSCSTSTVNKCFRASWTSGGVTQSTIMRPIHGSASVSNHLKMDRSLSSQTGYEQIQGSVLYLYEDENVDANSTLSLVWINGKSSSGVAGSLQATVTYTGGYNAPLNALAYSSGGWGSSARSCWWKWGSCCNSVAAIGYLPLNLDFCINVNITAGYSGVKNLVIGSSSASNAGNQLDVVVVPLANITNRSFQICNAPCLDPCNTATSCTDCVQREKCGWCSDAMMCMSGTSGGPNFDTCGNWRWTADVNDSHVISSAPGYPVSPLSLTYYLSAADPVPLSTKVSVAVPSRKELLVDIVLVQDVTKSFSSDFAIIAAQLSGVFWMCSAVFPKVQFGLASFSDKPLAPFGGPSDYVYQTEMPLTKTFSFVSRAYALLKSTDGGDVKQNPMEALLQLARRPDEIGFRLDGKRVALVLTRGPPHVPSDSTLPANNLDGVMDGTPPGAGENYVNPAALRQVLLETNIVPVFLVFSTKGSNHLQAYKDIVSGWGFGLAVGISGDLSVVYSIVQAIEYIFSYVTLIPLDRSAIVPVISPASYPNVASDSSVVFNVTFPLATSRLNISNSITQMVAPGYGSVRVLQTSNDMPTATTSGNFIVNQNDQIVLDLAGSSPYQDSLRAVVNSLPLRGSLYQYSPTAPNNRGVKIIAAGTVVLDAMFRVVFVPATNEYSADGQVYASFTYYVIDSCNSKSLVVIIHIMVRYSRIADPPSRQVTTNEDTPIDISLAYPPGAYDLSNTHAKVTSFPMAGTGALYECASGEAVTPDDPYVEDPQLCVRYVPPPNANGPAFSGFSYVLTDGVTTSNAATITINILPVNDAPIATTSGTINVQAGSSVSVRLEGYDVEGSPLTCNVLNRTLPAGTLVVSTSDGCNVTFTAGSSATSSCFDYTVSDGELASSPSRICFNVTPQPNNPPVLTSTSFTTNTSVCVIINLRATDQDGDPLTYTVTSLPTQGYFTAEDGTRITSLEQIPTNTTRLRFCPEPNSYTPSPYAVFTVSVSDGKTSVSGQVAIFVNNYNQPPTGTLQSINGLAGEPIEFSLTGQDPDDEDSPDSLTFRITRFPNGGLAFANGTAITASTVIRADDVLVYTPPDTGACTGNCSAPYDSFAYTATDTQGATGPQQTVQIECTFVNNSPVISMSDELRTDENQPLIITLDGYDPDCDPLTAFITDAFLNGSSIYQVLPNGSRGEEIFPIAGGRIEVTNPNRQIEFVPPPFQAGENFATITYILNDGRPAAQMPDSDPFTFPISINPINFPPYSSNTTITIQQDRPSRAFRLPTVVDREGDRLTVTITYVPPPSRGLFTLSTGEPVFEGQTFNASANSGLPTFVYYPPPFAFGDANNNYYFTELGYRVADPFAANPEPYAVSFAITPTNPLPQSTTPVTFSVLEDTPTPLAITAQDNDAWVNVTMMNVPTDGQLWEMDNVTLITNMLTRTLSPVNTTAWPIMYTPKVNSVASDSFSFSMTDRPDYLMPPTTVTINIIPVNDPPVITATDIAISNDVGSGSLSGISVFDVDAGDNKIFISLTLLSASSPPSPTNSTGANQTLPAPHGRLQLVSSNNNLAVIASSATSISFNASQSDINDVFINNGIIYSVVDSVADTYTDTLSIYVNDYGHSGAQLRPLHDTKNVTITTTVTEPSLGFLLSTPVAVAGAVVGGAVAFGGVMAVYKVMAAKGIISAGQTWGPVPE